MIPANRFIAMSDDRDEWLAARTLGVTATEVAKAATPEGFRQALSDRLNPVPVESNAYMRFGSDNEQWIALTLKRRHGLMPNHWLVAADGRPEHMATPDCLSLDHSLIGEIKTGGKESPTIPIAHRRQIQWQLWCTGADACIYAFMLRAERNGIYVPAWLEPKTQEVRRDEKMIADLIDTADRLMAASLEGVAA